MAEAPEAPPVVLIVEDDRGLAGLEARRLERAGLRTHVVYDLRAARAWLSLQVPDLAVVDYRLPDGHAGHLLDWLKEQQWDVPVVVVTGQGAEHVAVELLRRGARDYLVKSSQTLTMLPEVVTRVLAEERLRRELRFAQERYRFVVENGHDLITVSDYTGLLLFVSPSCQRLLGYNAQELEGTSSFALLHPDDIPAIETHLAHYRDSVGEPRPIEYRVRHKAGGWVWVESLSQSVSAPGGRTGLLISNTRDISERRAAEEHRRAYTALLEALDALSSREIQTQTPDEALGDLLTRLTTVLRADAAVIYAREGKLLVPRAAVGHRQNSAAGWYGPIEEGCVGIIASTAAPVEMHDHPVHCSACPCRWCVEEGFISLLGWPILYGGEVNGAVLVASRSPRPFTDSDRQLLAQLAGRAGLFFENAQLHAELVASEARYRDLVESAMDIIWELDTEGRITFVNRSSTAVLGYSPEELIGRSMLHLLSPDDWEWASQVVMDAVTTGGTFAVEVTLRHRDGHPVLLSIRGRLRRATSGRIKGLSAVARDMTRHRFLEERVRHENQLEAIGRLADGLAHDFNNLLTSILGSAQLLRNGCRDEQTQDLELILAETGRATCLTRQLLTLGRRQPIRPEPVGLNEVVQRLLGRVEGTLGENVALDLLLASQLPPIDADPGQMEQLVLNLCRNAREAMPHGGRLTIRTGRAELGPAELVGERRVRPGAFAFLAVADTGTGIAPDILPRVFEPYFTTKGPARLGTGLGLATVHGIVARHGGLIRVSSEPGKGSEFSVYLPLPGAARPETPASGAPAAEVPAASPLAPAFPAREGAAPRPPADEHLDGTERLLVAEDEGVVRELLCRVLRNHGYQVVAAADGNEAFARFMESPGAFDLVILDAVMPGADGPQVAAAMRQHRADFPVLYISGYGDVPIELELAGEAEPDFLPKPFSPREFLRRVRAALEKAPVDG